MLSIVTITYNNLHGIRKTAESINSQITNTPYEWIVIDGLSTDGTTAYLERCKKDNKESNLQIFSEPDHGIYDAMNKGIEKATGSHIWFLNAGDIFAAPDTLGKIQHIAAENHPDFIYGDSLHEAVNGEIFYKPSRSSHTLKYGMFTHHQSMIYKTDIIRKNILRYDTSYEIAADYKFTAQFLRHAENISYVPCALCCFEKGGISQTQARKGRLEQRRIKIDLGICSPIGSMVISSMQAASFILQQKMPHFFTKIKQPIVKKWLRPTS